jgi:hypothetical protein
VELLDSLIADFNCVDLGNIHLVGIVCCFITAKLMGKNYFKLECAVVGLGHNKFTKRDILMEEERILKIIF